MGTGRLPDDTLQRMVAAVSNVPGDFAEFGVFKGHLFTRLAKAAHGEGRIAHAFDSFRGMAKPGKWDGEKLPEGSLSVGGIEVFARIMDQSGAPRDAYRLHPGYVPDCFSSFSGSDLALAYVDLDHFEPTLQALRWVWYRMQPGGLLGMDDYFPGRMTYATPAIDQFLLNRMDWDPVEMQNSQLWVRKWAP